ncbi:LOB domain-containing protein 6-like [Phragmites australis]|uniref:LOB domain-containing protein 6-like n=1 Tax=Phragmites australis TaxID=29695 RepID=UPI002D7754CC|nr:LOB domain-containing protein 6-like [Phragmites australis]
MTSSPSSSKPPPHLLLHVDTTATANSSAVSSPSASSAHSSRTPCPSAGGSGGGTGQNQACAACKYQRRKCNPDCPLARYFPADQQRRFLNAHRLFGVSNIQKTLRRIDPELGPEAMHTLIYQSEARAADPIHGCVRIIKELERQLNMTRVELANVYHQIAIYRQAAAVDPLADPTMLLPPAATAAVSGQDNVVAMDAIYAGQEPVPAGAGVVFHDQQEYHVLKVEDQDHPPPHQLYDYFCYDGTACDEATSHDASVQQYGYANAGVKAGSPVELSEQLEQHCQIEAAPFVDAFDVKPQHLPLSMEHHGHAGVEQPEENVTAVLKYHADQPATSAAQCHLELGFSSF